MGKKAIVLFFALISVLVLFSSFNYAQEYYADLSIDVQKDGLVKITGITNEPSLSQGTYQEFTSKKGIYWILNISSDEVFSDYVVSVKLPEGTEINYLKTNGRSRISYDEGIKIVASGTESLNLVIQYRVNKKNMSFLLLGLVFSLICLVFISFFLLVRKKKIFKLVRKEIAEETKNKVKKSSANGKNSEKLDMIKKTLAEAQIKIIDLLLEEGGSLTQKQLQHKSGLPKATLSRNVDVLVKKNMVIKQSRGMTNMISINGEFKDK